MTTIDRRLTKLEQGRALSVHRPEGQSTEEFFGLMFKAWAAVPEGATVEERSRAHKPWLEAMTHAELKELAVMLEASFLVAEPTGPSNRPHGETDEQHVNRQACRRP